MKQTAYLKVPLMAATLLFATALPARAQDKGVEIGTSLTSLMVGFGDNNTTVLGVPSGGFGILNPGLYFSFFLAPKIAIEPQLGLIVVSGNGESAHIANFGAQVDYFTRGTRRSSPYVFGGVGVISVSDAGSTPTSVSGGAGYRMALGDRLTVRMDGRISHFTEGGGNTSRSRFRLAEYLGGNDLTQTNNLQLTTNKFGPAQALTC